MPTFALRVVTLCILVALVSSSYNETAIQFMYGSVADWVRFSPRPDLSNACGLGLPLRIAYFTRHSGTLWDWTAIANHLEVPWTRVNPGFFQTYGVNTTKANIIWAELGHMLCHMADILIFSDTIPDARPLLQGGCTTPLILQVTNRFDYGISPSEQDAYVQVMADAATRPHVWWVVNNPYEALYIDKRGVKLPQERLMLLRPVGVCLLPPTHLPSPDQALVALVQPSGPTHLENTFITPWLKSQSLTEYVRLYHQHYGGPSVLAQHRGVISIPYQMSVMKMYEGLSAGAVFVIPSPSFFKKLAGEMDDSKMVFCCRDVLRDYPDSWQDYFDWYHKDFINAHILFDSWEQLANLIKDREGTGKLVEEKRVVGKEAMRLSRQRTLDGYSSLYRSLSQQACESIAQPDVLSLGYNADAGV
ncbi:hypothetical protein Agub_g12093 [Astrephomene gubernaculifera]|uniref:Uncharacterized protein n=1 Tax=Astrephomene gubernaculifera TaxID=47775 RepID=A0AAD3HQG2_9CHLO|nr:hypothetical protein Agub_g12093 [Astrephomene gubernaculifera]